MRDSLLSSTMYSHRPTLQVRLSTRDDVYLDKFVETALILQNYFEIELLDENGEHYEYTVTERDEPWLVLT